MASKLQATIRAAAYARFSSEMQRDESIDAQMREIRAYARREGIVLTSEYIDKAKSATTDQRPEFQRMIADAGKGRFDVIIVHKLDRFARSRYDSAHYKYLLKRSGVEIRSVTENLDGSPESIVLESVLEGMAEYYSKNLAREVEKGKRENAIKGKHVGGVPPLGYDLDRDTMTLVINESEAEAVRIIFSMYLKGCGYSEIITQLNSNGYKTKRGQPFSKSSLFDILINEKYTGTYIYGKTASKNADGKFNRHKYKETSEIISIPDAIPAIISCADFQAVKAKMTERKRNAAKFSAKQEYLLSGKIVCGVCGSHYVGNSRKPRLNYPYYISYKCTKKNGAVKCDNPEVNRDALEREVLEKLASELFNEDVLPDLIKAYKDFMSKQGSEIINQQKRLQQQLRETDKGIKNIVDLVTSTGSHSLLSRLESLEQEKAMLEESLASLDAKLEKDELDPQKLASAFKKAKRMLKNGTLQNRKEIVDKYIDKIEINRDSINIKFNLTADYKVGETYRRDI